MNFSPRPYSVKFSIPNSSWQPDKATKSAELYLDKTEADLKIALSTPPLYPPRSNVTAEQRRFITAMKQSSDYIVKPADKNLGLTLMDRAWYDGEIVRQLADTNTYRPVSYESIPIRAIYVKICAIADLAKKQGLISAEAAKFILNKVTSHTAKVPQIYILPKVHKEPLKGRPIIPGVSWITTPASILVDDLLQPLLQHVPTVLADSKSLVIELNRTAFPQPDCRLITADVSSLYTEIPIDKGLAFIKVLMREHPDLIPPALQALISDLLRIVMENNYLQFGGKYYHQIKGTAMGTPAAVVFANIFMYILERGVLKKYGNDIAYYKRYLDDIFMIVNQNSEAIKTSLGKMEKNIKLEFCDSDHSATFLDLIIFKGSRYGSESILDTKVHQKQLNMYLYIPYCSSHPVHSKSSWITAELKRYIRNTSSFEDYLEIKKSFYWRLRARGYPPPVLTRAFSKARYRERSKLLLPAPPKKPVGSIEVAKVYFSTEFTPLTSSLGLRELLGKHLTPPLANTFVPSIAFRSAPSLHNSLCQNRPPPPLFHAIASG